MKPETAALVASAAALRAAVCDPPTVLPSPLPPPRYYTEAEVRAAAHQAMLDAGYDDMTEWIEDGAPERRPVTAAILSREFVDRHVGPVVGPTEVEIGELLARARARLAAVDPDDIERDDHGRFASHGGGGDSGGSDAGKPIPGQEGFDFTAPTPPPPAPEPAPAPAPAARPADEDRVAVDRASHVGHQSIDRLESFLGKPVDRIPGYKATPEDKRDISIGKKSYMTPERIMEVRAKSPDDPSKQAQCDKWQAQHVRACEALERAGKESPRSESRIEAIRQMADRLPPTTDVRVGIGMYGIKTERVQGMTDAFSRVGHEAMDKSALASVTLSDRHAGQALAFVYTGSGKSTLTMTDKGQSYGIKLATDRSNALIAAGKSGWTADGAARTPREMAQIVTLHELGHVFHGVAVRNETGTASSEGIRRDGANRAGEISDHPSRYGRENGAEYIAESFSLLTSGVVPSTGGGEKNVDYIKAIGIAEQLWRDAIGTEPPDPRDGPFAGRLY